VSRVAIDGLPLLVDTPRGWAELAARRWPVFLADHAVCEQQAALFALNLVAHYPTDRELVERMTSLAAEEVVHLRRVVRLLHARGLAIGRRRPNTYVSGLHARLRRGREEELKLDRLCVGALIEARSAERFTRLHEVVANLDRELAELLRELGPAELRHWELFHGLAGRDVDPSILSARWQEWLAWERTLMLDRGREPTVHG
jgi:tRNA-(ms[2]io[6]A)-hydroxylase